MAIKETNFDVIQGDTWNTTINVSDSNGDLIVFTGYTFIMEVRDKDGGKIICATASLGDGITVTEPGSVYIELTPSKTSNFVLPRSKYQIQSIDGSGRKKTLLSGWFNVQAGTIS